MNWILSIPVIVKVLGSLGFILVANRIIKNLTISALIGGVVLGAWCGHSMGNIFEISWHALLSEDTLMLILVLMEVVILSRQMSSTKITKDMVAAVQSKLSYRKSLAAMPAVIGLLPMPGGAVFSAPLVDDVDREGSIEPMMKTRINYWFRHIWEYWWPLYPGVQFTLSITKLNPLQLLLLHFPLTIASVVIGYFFFLRKVKVPVESGAKPRHRYNDIVLLMLPIIVVIVVYAIVYVFKTVSIAGEYFPVSNRYFPMAVGVLCAIAVHQYQRPLDPAAWKKVIFTWKNLSLASIVAALMIYGAFIKANLPDGTSLVMQMRNELDASGVPLIAVKIIIPFVSGMATGLAIGFVGPTFPIVIGLIGTIFGGTLLSTTVLAYGSGYIGMMLSPVHVCLVVTNEHFKTQLMSSITRLLAPAGVLFAVIFLYHLLIRFIFAG